MQNSKEMSAHTVALPTQIVFVHAARLMSAKMGENQVSKGFVDCAGKKKYGKETLQFVDSNPAHLAS